MINNELERSRRVGYWYIGITVFFAVAAIIFAVLYFTKKCPEQKEVPPTVKYIRDVEEIENATGKSSIDSLLLDKFGFQSE